MPFLKDEAVVRLGWTLCHFLWQGAVVAAALKLILPTLKEARLRYAISCAAMMMMAALPFVTFDWLAANPAMSHRLPPRAQSEGWSETSPGSPRRQIVEAQQPLTNQAAEPVLRGVVVGWILGAAFFSLRLCLSWVEVRRLLRIHSDPLEEAWLAKSRELVARAGIARPVRFLKSAALQVPAAIGWLKPVILVPAGMLGGLTPSEVEMILLHELAHIARHDFAINVLQSVVETLLFYHPAVWWVSNRVRAERELCCDDVAVRLSGSPLDLAKALTKLEESRLVPSLALSAQGSDLPHRIRRLLRPSTASSRGPQAMIASVTAFALVVGVCISCKAKTATKEEAAISATQAAMLQTRSFDVNVSNVVNAVFAEVLQKDRNIERDLPQKLSVYFQNTTSVPFPKTNAPEGRAIFLNIGTGKLLARATRRELDAVERVLQALSRPPQILLTARIYESKGEIPLPEEVYRPGDKAAGTAAILTWQQTRDFIELLAKTPGNELLSSPRAITTLTSGGANVSMSDAIHQPIVGVDFFPQLRPSPREFGLTTKVTRSVDLRSSKGDSNQTNGPVYSMNAIGYITFSARANLSSGQSMLLQSQPVITNVDQRKVWALVTGTLIDEKGKPLYEGESLPLDRAKPSR
jgi:beta-lactamase regulating signal transducer with metallopeptidase domain